MPVIEISQLRLRDEHALDGADSPVGVKLGLAKLGMQDYTGCTFYLMRDCEDPRNIYIVGEWASLKQHYDEWIPSETNQRLLEGLKDDVGVEWLMHIDGSMTTMPFRQPSAENETNEEKVVYSFERYHVEIGERDVFEAAYKQKSENLAKQAEPGSEVRVGGGWHVEELGQRELFVVWCQWNSITEHKAFRELERSPDAREYADLEDDVQRSETETNYMTILDL